MQASLHWIQTRRPQLSLQTLDPVLRFPELDVFFGDLRLLLPVVDIPAVVVHGPTTGPGRPLSWLGREFAPLTCSGERSEADGT